MFDSSCVYFRRANNDKETSPKVICIDPNKIQINNNVKTILGLNGQTLILRDDVISSTSESALYNKTLINPTINNINSNISVPSGPGTLALLSDITNVQNVVDLTSNQIIGGQKTFSISPTFDNGTLTLPSGPGVLARVSDIPSVSSFVDLTSNQTINGQKTFTTLQNFNSINININTLDAFKSITTSTTNKNELSFYQNSNKKMGVGYDPNTNASYIGSYDATPLSLFTNQTEALKIPSGGITIDNTASRSVVTNGIGGPTTIAYRIDGVFSNDTQTLTNKTLTNPKINTIINSSTSQTLQLPTNSGTLALLSDIPTISGFVDLTTNQIINGNKTFGSYIYINGTVPMPTVSANTGVFIGNEATIGQTVRLVNNGNGKSNIDFAATGIGFDGRLSYSNTDKTFYLYSQSNTTPINSFESTLIQSYSGRVSEYLIDQTSTSVVSAILILILIPQDSSVMIRVDFTSRIMNGTDAGESVIFSGTYNISDTAGVSTLLGSFPVSMQGIGVIAPIATIVSGNIFQIKSAGMSISSGTIRWTGLARAIFNS